jgi:hypothetical protein
MRFGIFALVVAANVIAVRTASAQSNLTLVPSVSVSTVYDDNLFAQKDGDAGIVTRFRPAFEGNYQSPNLTLLSLYSFDAQRSNHPALSSFDARRHGSLDLGYKTTPSSLFGLGVQYDRTDTPGELELETGILGERRTAERWEIHPSLLYRVRPRTSITLGYTGTTESLVEDVRGTMHAARAGVSRQTSTRDEITVSYVNRLFIDIFDRQTSNAVLLGWTRNLAYQTRFSIQGGPRYSSYEGALRPELNAGLTRATNRLRLALDYWHGETIILGIRGPVAIDSGMARFIVPLTQRTELGTHFGVSDSSTLGGENARVYRATLVGAWTPNGGPYTLAASYAADLQQGFIQRTVQVPLLPDDEILRHTVHVTLTIAPRLSRSFRPTGEQPTAKPQGEPQ